MFAVPTTLIVGAGASFELGFPLGSTLTSKIAGYLRTRDTNAFHIVVDNPVIRETLQRVAQKELVSVTHLTNAAIAAADAMAVSPSIDNYLYAHSSNQNLQIVAKVSLAASILEAEQGTALYVDPSNVFNKPSLNPLKATWYGGFWQRLSDGVRLEDVDTIFNNLRIITFNYDRCIEQYLFWALQHYFGLPRNNAKELMETRLQIFHPYGQVGPFQRSSGDYDITFGEEIEPESLTRVWKDLRTFSEQVASQAQLKDIKKAVQEASTLVFLGMAYHRQNLEILTPPTQCSATKVFGTTYGLSDGDAIVVQSRIDDMLDGTLRTSAMTRLKPSTYFVRKTCAELFQEFSLIISV